MAWLGHRSGAPANVWRTVRHHRSSKKSQALAQSSSQRNSLRACYTSLTRSYTMLRLTSRRTLCSLPHRPASIFSLRRAAYSTNSKKSSLPPFEPEPYPLTQSPNPTWKLGDGLRNDTELTERWKGDEDQGWKSWDLERLGPL